MVSTCAPWPASTRKPTPRAAKSCTMLTKWARFRPSRSSFQTTSTSSFRRARRQLSTVAYLRVSTPQQDVRSQRLAILEYARKQDIRIDDFIEATASGQASEKRRRLDELTSVLGRGDRLVVSELSRLGRAGEETYPTGVGLRPGAKAPETPPTPYRPRASPRLYTNPVGNPETATIVGSGSSAGAEGAAGEPSQPNASSAADNKSDGERRKGVVLPPVLRIIVLDTVATSIAARSECAGAHYPRRRHSTVLVSIAWRLSGRRSLGRRSLGRYP